MLNFYCLIFHRYSYINRMHNIIDNVISKNISLRSTNALRILVAEDNELNRKVTLAMLKHLGHRADIAVSGIDVLRALEHRQYDLILMNICMPMLDGIETTIEIRRRYHNGPKIIGVTAYTLPGIGEKCLKAGMDAYIIKPVSVNDLKAALGYQTAGQHKRDLNRHHLSQ